MVMPPAPEMSWSGEAFVYSQYGSKYAVRAKSSLAESFSERGDSYAE
jgi:hypothetical protein